MLALVCLVFAPVAIAFGLDWGLLALLGGLAVMLVWHLNHLSQLLNWLEGPLNAPLPRGRGA